MVLLATRAVCWLMVTPLAIRTPTSFSAELPSSSTASSTCYFPTRWRTLRLPLVNPSSFLSSPLHPISSPLQGSTALRAHLLGPLAAYPDPPQPCTVPSAPALLCVVSRCFPSSPHHVGGSAASRLSGCFHELSLLSSSSVLHLLPLFSSAVADGCACRLGWETPLTTKPCVRGLPVCSLQMNTACMQCSGCFTSL